MLLHPLQNTAALTTAWIQKRPVITQGFYERPEVYKPMGLNAHGGYDFRAKVGTPIFASMDGVVRVEDTGKVGYGLHIKIRSEFKKSELVLAHLSQAFVKTGDKVAMGDLIGLTGNSGFSSAAHLHVAYRLLNSSNKNIWDWTVKNYLNGYKGYIDFLEYMICWKGTHLKNNHGE